MCAAGITEPAPAAREPIPVACLTRLEEGGDVVRLRRLLDLAARLFALRVAANRRALFARQPRARREEADLPEARGLLLEGAHRRFPTIASMLSSMLFSMFVLICTMLVRCCMVDCS